MGDKEHDIFRLELRSFIPYRSFANGFHGDDRGFSVSGHGTSRMSAVVDLMPQSGRFRDLSVDTDATYGPLEGIGPLVKGYSKPRATITVTKTDLGARYTVQIAGSDPIVSPAPDVDVKAEVSI